MKQVVSPLTPRLTKRICGDRGLCDGWLYHAYLQGRPLVDILLPLGVLAGMTVVLFLIAIPRFKYQVDQLPVPAGDPFEMIFSLLPTSYQFHAGSRIRITVAFADAGNFGTPVLNPAPMLQVLRDTNHSSYVEMPVILWEVA